MQRLKEAYVGYMPHGSTAPEDKGGVKLSIIKTDIKQPENMYNLKYVRYAANAFSYMIGLQMHLSKRFSKQVDRVIVADNQLAKYIGCHPKHSSKVIKQIIGIFDLEYRRLPEQGGAREIVINDRVIEFLKIYDAPDLHFFIKKYNIDKQYFKAIQQIFRYRVWGVKDTQLSPELIEKKKAFLKQNNNFFHRLTTSNKADSSRIQVVRKHKELLSPLNMEQLERIQEERKTGILSHYWMMILIKLEQKITKLLSKKKATSKETKAEEVQTIQPDSESTESSTVQHTRATAAAVKDPEEDSPAAVLEIMIAFNNMILDQAIPEVTKMNKNHFNAIRYMLTQIRKETILEAIRKVPQLIHDTRYDYKMTFERLMTVEKVMWINNKITKDDVQVDFLSAFYNTLEIEAVNSIELKDNVEVSNQTECITLYNQLKQA